MTEVTKPRGRWRRRILTVAIAGLLALLVGRAIFDFWARRRVDEVAARVEQKFGSLDQASLTPAPVPAEENRARAMRAAASLLAGKTAEHQPAFSAFTASRTPVPVPAGLRAFVDASEPALKVAHDARGRRQSNWEVDYATGNAMPSLLDIRSLSNALYLEARIALDEDRPDAAATSITTGLALSSSLRQEPNLVTQLIRIAVGTRHFDAVQRLLTASEPSGSSLADVAAWLSENRLPDPMELGLLSELKHFNAMWARAETVGLQALTGETTPPSPWMSPVEWLLRPLGRILRVRQLEQMELLLESQKGARPRTEIPAPSSWALPQRLAHVAVPGLERAIDTGDQFNGQLVVAELAVALRRYRLDHGQYPEDLSQLSPAYLAAVPNDPQTGKPPAYSRQGAGFHLRAEKPRSTTAQHAALLEWTVPK
jgi:hypothetical protein